MATEIDIAVTTTTYNVSITAEPNEYIVNITTNSGGGGVQSVTGTTVNNTDPLNPVVGVPNLTQVLTQSDISTYTVPIPNNTFVTFDLGRELTENYFTTDDVGTGGVFLDKDVVFPDNATIRFQAGYVEDNVTPTNVTLLPYRFTTDAYVFYQGAIVTDITLRPEDVCMLKLDGENSTDSIQIWFLTVVNKSSGGGAVDSVNGQTGVVVLDAADVGAEPTKGSDDNYVTDAQLVVIGNTSGTNSGDNATNTTSNAYADAKVADTIADGVTTVAPSQNAVFDALALKQNNLVLGKKGNASSPVTGTTTETILESIFIPAGSVAVNDIIYIRNRVFKTGATGGFTVRYRINSSNSISGSSVLGFATLGAGSIRSQGLERTLNLRASNTIEVVDNTTSIAYENTTISNANVNITFTFTSDFWILITGQLTGVADSIVNSNYIIQKF